MKIATIDASDPKHNLSESSTNLINQLDLLTKKNCLTQLNNSASAIKDTVNLKTTRHRTKSWTTLSVSPSNDSNFYSDNENTKKRLIKHEKLIQFQSGSGDNLHNKSKTEEIKADNSEKTFNSSLLKKNKRLVIEAAAVVKQLIDSSVTPNNSIKLNKSSSETHKPTDISNDSNKENVLDANNERNISSATEILFVKSPKDMKTLVFMDDTDSESESNDKKAKEVVTVEGDGQCVPVVFQPANQESYPQSHEIVLEVNNQILTSLKNLQEKPTVDDSCEPMDIDVSIPENNSSIDSKDTKKQELSNKTPVKETRKSMRRSSQSIPEDTASESLDKFSNENKSTLIFTQISTSKSPQVLNELSKSISVTDIAKEMEKEEREVVNKNLPVNYLTSTPVQQKDTKKPELQMNTSVITSSNKSKQEINVTKGRSKVDISIAYKSTKNYMSHEDSDNELSEESKENNSFVDSEAEDAGDSYESGDSQNEDEKQYEIDNEILEEGETLTSEEESFTDSDYEKGSFVVSSDEEDNELLSGSGDDLDMSDNELTMSAKSKLKYNERKKKEQKKASREIYEARHKLDNSGDFNSEIKSKKNNRQRLESGEDNNMPPKKNKRMRLESTFETSDPNSDAEGPTNKNKSLANSDSEAIGYKKKKSKRLSESVCNISVASEKEISITENGTEEKDPLLVQVKPEPNTHQKSLDISVVHFIDRDEIEGVQVDKNISMVKPNEASDPLQESDMSSISENEDITKKFDSVLNELNKENKRKQIKTSDMSLNLDKKQKKSKEPVIEELNLTIAKKSKKKVKDESEKLNEKTIKRAFKKISKNNDFAINLNMLFSDDSLEVEKSSNQTGNAESFIPLKRTEAKTDVRPNLGKLNLTS